MLLTFVGLVLHVCSTSGSKSLSHPPVSNPTRLAATCCCVCSTLISTKDSGLVTILGRHQLSPRQFALGPLGNLLHNGQPVPSGAAFNVKGQLIGADMTSVLYSP